MVKEYAMNEKIDNYFLFPLSFMLLSAYVVYEQATSSLSIDMAIQVERHLNMLAGSSEFYNPWQYRIFSTYVLETFIVMFSKISGLENSLLPYFTLRFLQNLLIFFIALKFYKALQLQSKYLIVLGILLLGYNMSNSVFQSDLSFNTYFDVLFYLTAGYLILADKKIWILPLMIVAALNRETSALIPFLVMASAIDFRNRKIRDFKSFKIGIGAFIIFLLVFVSLRLYYGMPPASGIHEMSSPMDFLKFNLTFFRMYPQLLGTLGIIPLFVVFKFKSLSLPLKMFFMVVVPVWFIIHLVKSQAMETRLFLVPQAMIFIPAFLYIIEKELIEKKIIR